GTPSHTSRPHRCDAGFPSGNQNTSSPRRTNQVRQRPSSTPRTLNRAVAVLETAIEIAVRTGHRHREAALWSHLADIHHRAGREDEARELQTRAISMFADIDAGGFEPELWLLTRW